MEAVMLSSSLEKPSSPYKQVQNPKRIGRSFVSKPSENLAPMNNIHGGLLFAPTPSFSSYPPSAPLMNHIYQNHQQNPNLLRQQQPPLLPLPISQPLHSSLPARYRPLSSYPSSRKTNRSRAQSLTPKKSKSKPLASKGEEQKPKKDSKPVEAIGKAKESVVGLGPDPNDLPKNVFKVLLSSPSLTPVESNAVMNDLEMFPGSILTLSPPPSSLPLPKFSLRPKLRCNAEAAGIDAGATDDLQRLLRLR
ncbi:hypothetical protein SLE2022_098390 [Rubroshorea leprosula]